ncbi:ABC transporter substrate-binding protein [Mycolicibacterium mageritense DSM 44476 = CIP 104973]|uniref:Carnitine transport binding protein OpuCC n=1 Tax=Mycolicibacterium mageritense TaxID=53462 RepID=A0AAI8XJC9_MYCME|nr:ABC transporter substrate-binding protein [Mycolicibacterium mageritense]MCC9186455.1 ABC transporter substrate-binding protein [Mycolicibacterium mageritense]BBX34127.1 glycine/betaine ABC transporter substrate-binding protein [Mycolicibacterium mageritense]BDY27354.1 Carnitine transport binding protein OpuCC [Mycolicibacterium mageritense]CDO21352.1 glycine betaine ABC transporter substrate-binding protein [Mycolicibacterium mageritense DSM 44476 = CIP 104973]
MIRRKFLSALVTTMAAALTVSACGLNSDPLSSDGAAGSEGSGVIIGSADFTESQLIASIYSQALQAKGISVTEQFNIGSREVYLAALKDGSIDLVPEYSGALLSHLNPESTASSTEAVITGLVSNMPSGITMLAPSPAQDKDVVAVTQATADKYKLRKISDLAPVAGEMVLGGPPEWKSRVQGVVGLRDVYGLNFKEFVSLDAGGTLTMTALTNGQIQAGDLFSTDPGLKANHLVALEDDKDLFAAENVIPLIKSAKQTETITKALNAVSAKLTTDDLIDMNAEAAKGTNLSDIAKKWLADAGLSGN